MPIGTSVCSHTLVLEPWESGVVHHGVDLWQHRVVRTDADSALDFLSCEENLVSDLMPCGAGSLLFDDSAEDTPWFTSDTT